MAILDIQNEKRENANNYRTLCEVLEKVVPSVLEQKDGKVFNKRFVTALEEKAVEVFGTFDLRGNERQKFFFTNNRCEKISDGIFAYSIKVENYELFVTKRSSNQTYATAEFAIYAVMDEKGNCRVSKELSNTKVGDGSWCLPRWKDCVSNLNAVIERLEKCTADKMELCMEKLKAISMFIEETLKDVTDNDARSYTDVDYLREATILMKEEWYKSNDFKGLYDFHYLLNLRGK